MAKTVPCRGLEEALAACAAGALYLNWEGSAYLAYGPRLELMTDAERVTSIWLRELRSEQRDCWKENPRDRSDFVLLVEDSEDG